MNTHQDDGKPHDGVKVDRDRAASVLCPQSEQGVGINKGGASGTCYPQGQGQKLQRRPIIGASGAIIRDESER